MGSYCCASALLALAAWVSLLRVGLAFVPSTVRVRQGGGSIGARHGTAVKTSWQGVRRGHQQQHQHQHQQVLQASNWFEQASTKGSIIEKATATINTTAVDFPNLAFCS